MVVIAVTVVIGIMGLHLMVNQSTLRLMDLELRKLEANQLKKLDAMPGVRVLQPSNKKTGEQTQ
ncbi:MAG: hypothetical protein ACJASX_003232 [Limisphaerales bacterium]|jgi:hypothetical protein